MSWLRRGDVFVCLRMMWAMNQIAWLIGYPPRDMMKQWKTIGKP
jgi:hypothetical protein